MKKEKGLMAGNVSFYFATLKISNKALFQVRGLKCLAEGAVSRLGFKIRRMAIEDYGRPKGAYTAVAFLNESHLILTSYPQKKLLELEFASCKAVVLANFVGWLSKQFGLEIISEFGIDKDDKGRWERNL